MLSLMHVYHVVYCYCCTHIHPAHIHACPPLPPHYHHTTPTPTTHSLSLSRQVVTFVITLHARITLQQQRHQLTHLGLQIIHIPRSLVDQYIQSIGAARHDDTGGDGSGAGSGVHAGGGVHATDKTGGVHATNKTRAAPATLGATPPPTTPLPTPSTTPILGFSVSHSVALVLPQLPIPHGFAHAHLPLPPPTTPGVLGGRAGYWSGRLQQWLVLDCSGSDAGGVGASTASRWLLTVACDVQGVPLRLLRVKWLGVGGGVEGAVVEGWREGLVQSLRMQLQVCVCVEGWGGWLVCMCGTSCNSSSINDYSTTSNTHTAILYRHTLDKHAIYTQALATPFAEAVVLPSTPPPPTTTTPTPPPLHTRFTLTTYSTHLGGLDTPLHVTLDINTHDDGVFYLYIHSAAATTWMKQLHGDGDGDGGDGDGGAMWKIRNLTSQCSWNVDHAVDHAVDAHGGAAVVLYPPVNKGEDTLGTLGTLRLQYNMQQGHGVMTVLCDVHSVYRTQLLAKRLRTLLGEEKGAVICWCVYGCAWVCRYLLANVYMHHILHAQHTRSQHTLSQHGTQGCLLEGTMYVLYTRAPGTLFYKCPLVFHPTLTYVTTMTINNNTTMNQIKTTTTTVLTMMLTMMLTMTTTTILTVFLCALHGEPLTPPPPTPLPPPPPLQHCTCYSNKQACGVLYRR